MQNNIDVAVVISVIVRIMTDGNSGTAGVGEDFVFGEELAVGVGVAIRTGVRVGARVRVAVGTGIGEGVGVGVAVGVGVGIDDIFITEEEVWV